MALRIGFAFNEKPSEEEEPPSSESQDRFAEWDDPDTIDAVAEALGQAGTVLRLDADDDFPLHLRDARPDVVFNIAEGLRGPNREAHIPAICEYYGVPYTGSDPFTLALGLDKERSKEVLVARGVPTPRWTVMGTGSRHPGFGGLSFPLIVKPLYEGSSKGIDVGSLCATPAEALERVAWVEARYAQPAMVEEFITGREFTVAVLGNGPEATALPLVEICFESLPAGAPPLYGWEAKWIWDTPEAPLAIFRCPARVDPSLAGKIASTALEAFHALGCRDWSRVDLRLDAHGLPHVLEVNALPGILPDPKQNSCFPKAARAAGMDYPTMIVAVLDAALERLGMAEGVRERGTGGRHGKTAAIGTQAIAVHSPGPGSNAA